jgi:hypothetical protein
VAELIDLALTVDAHASMPIICAIERMAASTSVVTTIRVA